jgi:hypothetical protein
MSARSPEPAAPIACASLAPTLTHEPAHHRVLSPEPVPRPLMLVPRPSTPPSRPVTVAAGLGPLPHEGFFNFVLNLSKIWMKIDYNRVNLDKI